jgi:hypothetical protein
MRRVSLGIVRFFLSSRQVKSPLALALGPRKNVHNQTILYVYASIMYSKHTYSPPKHPFRGSRGSVPKSETRPMRTKKLNLVIVPLGKTTCFRDGRRPGRLNHRYTKSLR